MKSPTLKIEISKRDKRMLLILVLFFAALGYYYLVLAPLWEMRQRVAARLDSAKSELALTRTADMQLNSWQSYCARLGGRIARIYAMIEAPPLDVPAPERIDAIMKAAAGAGVAIDSLKPIAGGSSSSDESASTAKPVVAAGFEVGGSCSYEAFVKFLRSIYGMGIKRFSLSKGDASDGLLRFNLIVESLPLGRRLHLTAKAPRDGLDYAPTDDLFIPKPELRRFAPSAASATVLERVALEGRLRGLRLEGTAAFDGTEIAIVYDPADENSPISWLRAGDRTRGAEVMKVSSDGVTFSDAYGSCLLRFDSYGSVLIPVSGPAPEPKAAKLGLEVRALTPESAKADGVKLGGGLLVLKSKPGSDLQADDVIVALDGIATPSISEALRVLQRFCPGDILAVTFIRNGRELKTQVKLD